MFRHHVKQAARRIGMRSPVLWLNPHSAGHMVGRMGERAVIYDITDDWTAMTQSDRLTKLIATQDQQLCRMADAVIVCSERLRQLKQDTARNLHLIPNGVDAKHYASVFDGTGPLPDAATRWARPVFGYTGSVHGDRVDVELVREVARRIDGTLVFIGPDMLTAEQRRRMTEPGNVIVNGPVSYQELPQYMRAFDACVVPHCVSAFTESLNPIKLFEYLAAGKPIVSTDVAGFRDYPQFVLIACTADEFAAACKSALGEPADRPAARRHEAAKHSWSSRVDKIEEVMADVVANRPMQKTTTNT
jgi:glycosyltransferase involved in cell wall biosynthesis